MPPRSRTPSNSKPMRISKKKEREIIIIHLREEEGGEGGGLDGGFSSIERGRFKGG